MHLAVVNITTAFIAFTIRSASMVPNSEANSTTFAAMASTASFVAAATAIIVTTLTAIEA